MTSQDTTYYPPAFDSNGRQYDRRLLTPPNSRGPYVHSSECPQRDTVLKWELVDIYSRTWRRFCGGHSSCSIVEYDSPKAPAPPKPDDADVETFTAEHGQRHTEVKLEVAPGDDWDSWVLRCTQCRETLWFRGQAASHYAAHDIRLSNRAPIKATMVDLLRPEDRERLAPETLPKASPLAAKPTGKSAADVVAEADAAGRRR